MATKSGRSRASLTRTKDARTWDTRIGDGRVGLIPDIPNQLLQDVLERNDSYPTGLSDHSC